MYVLDELRDAYIERFTSAEIAALSDQDLKESRIVYDTDSKVLRYYDGTAWRNVYTSSEVLRDFDPIGQIGVDSDQFVAGHIFELAETIPDEDALYLFNSGAIETDSATTTPYTLTNVGSIVNATGGGIFGATSNNNAVTFTGSEYFHVNNLLGTRPTVGLGTVIDFWIKPADGQPSSDQVLLHKINIDGGGGAGDHAIKCTLKTTGHILFEVSNGSTLGSMSAYVYDGVTTPEWILVSLAWDQNRGTNNTHLAVLSINGVAKDTAATEYMTNESTGETDFFIGSDTDGVNNYEGDMCMFRVRSTAYHTSLPLEAFARKVAIPYGSSISEDYSIELLSKDSSDGVISKIQIDEITRKNSYIYIEGRDFNQGKASDYSTKEDKVIAKA